MPNGKEFLKNVLGGSQKQQAEETGPSNTPVLLGDNRDTGQPIWFFGQEMGVTVGSVGSGKFHSAIAPNLLTYPGSCFIIDPKGEACAVTAGARQRFGKVVRLDPFNKTEFAPGAYAPPLVRFNPLDLLNADDFSFPSDVATLVKAIMLPQRGSGDPFWHNSAEQLIQAIIMLVCDKFPAFDKDRSFSMILWLLSSPPERWTQLLQEMTDSRFVEVQNCGARMQSIEGKTLGGVVQQACSDIGGLDFPELREVMGPSTVNLADLFVTKDENGQPTAWGTTIYLILPANRIRSHSRWLRVMLAASLLVATQYKRAQLAYPILWLIDEAAQLGTMEAIPDAYALLRGYGVRIWTFWQNIGQIKSLYPNEWQVILGNSFNQLLSCGNDRDTAEHFAPLAGMIDETKKTEQVAQGKGLQGLVFGDPTTGYSYSVQREQAVRPDQLLTLHEGYCFLKEPNKRGDFFRKHPYFTDAVLRPLAADNPYVERRQNKP